MSGFSQLFGWVGEKFKLQMVAFAIISIMAVQGAANLQGQWGIMGEFSNLPQEELLDWISSNTGPSGLISCQPDLQLTLTEHNLC